MVLYYEITFAITVVLAIFYVFIWNKHFDVNITAIFLLVPIANLGYVLEVMATDLGSAITAQKIVYIGGCFCPYFVTMSILNLSAIEVKRWIRTVFFILNAGIYLSVMTIGYLGLFYKGVTLENIDGTWILVKDYGPMHTVFHIALSVEFVIGFAAIAYSLFKKRQVSKWTLMLLFLPEAISMLGFFGNKIAGNVVEVMPVAYIFAEVTYLLIVRRISLYDVSDMVVESMVQTGDTGFISIDFNHHYLGSNETAKNIMPVLRDMTVDQTITKIPELEKNMNHWLKHFEEDDSVTKNLYLKRDPENEDNNKMYLVNVNYLYDGKRKRGYQIFLVDDTQNQKYISLMDRYNTELEEEVEEKTQHIIEMHDNLIMGMATMVESRDNSTGGHIRRTSAGVRILIEEIRKDGKIPLSQEFCRNIIKAAPMHDIGKIAVDDAVLRKPGRFTDKEFAEMKKHAAEGARIIHEILKDTDDEAFKVIAENVAHYHHERIDGSGYPEGLKGEAIPIEARIMAIADVYDALVSKRVYKEKMSFEEADRIIMEGMGTQFDLMLKPYYEKARPRLEEYYRNLE